MVNEKLLNWIKSEEARGHSEKALTKILTKQNYSNKAIQEAFNLLKKENKKTPFSISFALLLGLGFLSLVLIGIMLFTIVNVIAVYFSLFLIL